MENNILDNKLLDEIENRKNHYHELKKWMPYNDKIIWANKKIEEFLEYCIRNNNYYITFLLIFIKFNATKISSLYIINRTILAFFKIFNLINFYKIRDIK